MKNSLVVFILIIIIFISVFPIISIKAQNDNNSIQIIYAQTFVKNAEDNLVSYMESDRIKIVNVERVIRLINDESTKIIDSKIIEVNDQRHELLTFERAPVFYFPELTQGVTFLAEDEPGIRIGAYFQNDGYHLAPDDKVTAIWTVIMPLE